MLSALPPSLHLRKLAPHTASDLKVQLAPMYWLWHPR